MDEAIRQRNVLLDNEVQEGVEPSSEVFVMQEDNECLPPQDDEHRTRVTAKRTDEMKRAIKLGCSMRKVQRSQD